MKTRKINLLYLLLIFAITSCSLDDVKIDRQSDITEKDLVQDENSARAVLNRVYTGFRTTNVVRFSGALMVSGTEQEIAGEQLGIFNFDKNNIQPKELSVSDDFYTGMYFIINTSNHLIQQVEAGKAEGITEPAKNEILGEAKTLRAYARFMLLRAFGQFYDINSKYGIVINNKPVSYSDKLARNTVKESYKAIIEDLQFGVANNADAKEHFYVTKSTAKAFLAKVYLYQKEFVKAEQLAKEVIDTNAGGYALEATYAQIYSKRWKSTEVLFAPYTNGRTEQYSGTEMYGDEVLRPSSEFRTLADKQVASEPADLFTNFSGYDPRFIFSYQRPTGKPNSQNFKYTFSSYTEGNTIYYMRMAEVYLIYAEAAARNNKLAEAVNAINKIRKRANEGITVTPIEEIASTNKDEVLKFVREEKMLELFLETGETWFDIVRYIDNGNLNFDVKESLKKKEQLIFPIPVKAIIGNNKMIQNPGYSS